MTEDNSMWVAKENLFYAYCTWRYAGIMYPIAGLELTRARYKRPLADLDLHRLDINEWKYRAVHMFMCLLLRLWDVFCWLRALCTHPTYQQKNKVTLSLWGFCLDYMHGMFLLSWTTMTM